MSAKLLSILQTIFILPYSLIAKRCIKRMDIE